MSQNTEHTTDDQPFDHSDDAQPNGAQGSTGGSESENAKQVEQLKLEVAAWKDKCLRAIAESENVRRRSEREKSDAFKFATENLIKDLIPFLDSFEKAAAPPSDHATAELKSYADGVAMVFKQFMTVLAKHGVEPVKSEGAPFDPNVHQAIQRVESNDVTSEQVDKEFAKGYTLNGRLVRPAMVSVLVPAKS